jgi:hypothetical protein
MNEYYPQSPDQYNPQSGKLVLPAYNDATLPSSEDAKTTYIPMGQSPSSPYDSPVRPEPLMQNYAASSYASGQLKPRSRSNPAQLILLIAIIVVLIATGSVAYAAVTVIGPTLTKSNSAATQANTSAAASTQASATVVPTATPVPSPTPGPTPISTFDGAPLTLTIEDLPNEVNNGDSGPVTVQTNAAGIPVHLQVTYAAPPFSYTSETQVTDANGQATLTWDVQINPKKRRTNAQVVAVAQESNGQQVQSDTLDVKILR